MFKLSSSFAHFLIISLCFYNPSLGIPVHSILHPREPTYPPKIPADLLPLYFITCATNAELIANGQSLKDATPYGTALRFQLHLKKTKSTSPSPVVLRFLLYDLNQGIPPLAVPAKCLGGYAVVKFNLVHSNVDIEDLVGIPALSKYKNRKTEDAETVPDVRDVVILRDEQDEKVVVVVLLNNIVASPPTLMYAEHSMGGTAGEAWEGLQERRGQIC
ncbi:hypothetical protein J3R30DRAFT_3729392 [Lentinula aciculospora]|uniref:Uncharacterized protein n=1 Tax=Lentinula aciculospora TaxID=153920 RepID=A0A9W9DYY4_9AGAR|nr:hypothetical protein J3R30DRAFT_3729392 [Lentinula aciculospora]